MRIGGPFVPMPQCLGFSSNITKKMPLLLSSTLLYCLSQIAPKVLLGRNFHRAPKFLGRLMDRSSETSIYAILTAFFMRNRYPPARCIKKAAG
ncbi:hypothetical protein BDN70DRAFT_273509 [Pholiota conissans]|uniref:Uncharacterized protein n=1 Tax=Pholiota conissans TaxID=109636 RepID=A0A9P5YUT5_9AGAR|nr:hypothetical protein BDN70DRAFT_273509 [Pholiota conissans]